MLTVVKAWMLFILLVLKMSHYVLIDHSRSCVKRTNVFSSFALHNFEFDIQIHVKWTFSKALVYFCYILSIPPQWFICIISRNWVLLAIRDSIYLTRSIWKMLGPLTTASRLTPIHQMSPAVLSRAACASMSRTTTTTRDKGPLLPHGMGPMTRW